jgi:hypothetical protein
VAELLDSRGSGLAKNRTYSIINIDRVARNRSAFLAEAARERLRELAEA